MTHALNQEAVDWAWAQPIANNPGARIVLMCLARRADEAWECTASQEEVAADALLSARSTRRHMEQLEGDGHIQRRKRFDGRGHRLPDLCRLNPSKSLPANLDGKQVSPPANLASGERDLPANLDGRQVGPAAKLAGRESDHRPDCPVGDPDETDTPSSEPVANLTSGQIGRASSSPSENYKETSSPSEKKGGAGGNSRRPRADEEHPRFADWYATYPIHKAKGEARKAFSKAVAKAGDVELLIEGAKRYRRDPDYLRGYGKNPATWLNGECWDDEPRRPPAETGRSPSGGSGPSSLPPRDGYTTSKSKIFGTRSRS